MPVVDLDNQGSNRFRLSEDPPAPPAQCAICGYAGRPDDSQDRKRLWIDFDMTMEFYGAVLFCDECAIEMARLLGLVTPEVYDELTEKYQSAVAEIARLGEYERLVNNMRNVIPHEFGTGTGTVSSPEQTVPAKSPSRRRTVKEQPDIDEFSDESGSDDISGSTSGDPALAI